jgi:hypothetical protein
MGPALYVLAILGCGEADTACQTVSVTQQQYVSIGECNAATTAAVEQNADLAFPVVVAQCARADSQLAQQVMPSRVDLPEANGEDRRVIQAAMPAGRDAQLARLSR